MLGRCGERRLGRVRSLEVVVRGQRFRPIPGNPVVDLDRLQIEPPVDRSMHSSGRYRKLPDLLGPSDAGPLRNEAEAANDFVVLRPLGVRPHAQDARVKLQAIGDCYRPAQHPVERDIRQSAFVLAIAASDIRMISRKPHLLEPIDAVGITRGGLR